MSSITNSLKIIHVKLNICSFAMAKKWSTALGGPSGCAAFSKDFLVMKLLGLISFSNKFLKANPALVWLLSFAKWQNWEELKGRAMPQSLHAEAMVLAVYIPTTEPCSLGRHFGDTLWNPFFVHMVPSNLFTRNASKAETISTSFIFKTSGQWPPKTITEGPLFNLIIAISAQGNILSTSNHRNQTIVSSSLLPLFPWNLR